MTAEELIAAAVARERDWYDYLTGLVPLAIAAAVAVIAWRQWRTSHEQLHLEQTRFEHQKELDEARFAHDQRMADLEQKRELFDRRAAVVEAFREYLGVILRDAVIEPKDIARFQGLGVRPSQHLFSKEVFELLKRYLDEGFELMQQNRRSHTARDEKQRLEAIDKEDAALQWLTENADAMFDAFAPFMNLAEVPPASTAGRASLEGELSAPPPNEA